MLVLLGPLGSDGGEVGAEVGEFSFVALAHPRMPSRFSLPRFQRRPHLPLTPPARGRC